MCGEPCGTSAEAIQACGQDYVNRGVDCVAVVGGDGLGAGDNGPEGVTALCSGRMLAGPAEAAYEAAGPLEGFTRRGVAGMSGNTLILCLPTTNTAAAVDAVCGLLEKYVPGDNDVVEKVQNAGKLTSIVDRPRESQFLMMEMEDALKCIELRGPSALPGKDTLLSDVLGCATADNVRAGLDHPPFRASIKDGYAVLAADGVGERKILGAVTAGASTTPGPLSPGTAIRVSTGGEVPEGDDIAVVQLEDTTLLTANTATDTEVTVNIKTPSRGGQDIRQKGSDFTKGSTLVPKGALLGSAEVGLLAATGVSMVKVVPKVKVAVFSSGDEVVGVGKGLQNGQIYDSNRPALLAAITEAGGEAIDLGIIPDTAEEISAALRRGADLADITLSSGGVSMGEKDLLKPSLISIGAEIHFGRIEMKPGKPTTFATLKDKSFLGLPGNPVSCLVCFQLFCVPLMRKRGGRVQGEWHHPRVQATLCGESALPLDSERCEYHRVVVSYDGTRGALSARSTGTQRSSRLLSMRGANGLLCLPKGTKASPTALPGTSYECVLFAPLQ